MTRLPSPTQIHYWVVRKASNHQVDGDLGNTTVPATPMY